MTPEALEVAVEALRGALTDAELWVRAAHENVIKADGMATEARQQREDAQGQLDAAREAFEYLLLMQRSQEAVQPLEDTEPTVQQLDEDDQL